jgi:predicted  nucleic acid-binding Zn-ribbon protein
MSSTPREELVELRTGMANLGTEIEKLQAALDDIGEALDDREKERVFEQLDERDAQQKLERRLALAEASLQTLHEEVRALKHGAVSNKRKRAAGKLKKGRKKQRKE